MYTPIFQHSLTQPVSSPTKAPVLLTKGTANPSMKIPRSGPENTAIMENPAWMIPPRFAAKNAIAINKAPNMNAVTNDVAVNFSSS